MDILIGLALVAVVVMVVFLAKHHVKPGTDPKVIAVGIGSALETGLADLRAHVSEEVSRVPALVSAEIQSLTEARDAAIARAEQAEADKAAAEAAHAAQIAAVASRVTAAIQASPELPQQA
jgi:hypothetical protein